MLLLCVETFAEHVPFMIKLFYHILIVVVSFILFKKFFEQPVKRTAESGTNAFTATDEPTDPSESNVAAEINKKLLEVEPALPHHLKHIPYHYVRNGISTTFDIEMLPQVSEVDRIAAARRTLGFFSPNPVSKEVIRNIVRIAGTAPSGVRSSDLWTFVAISDPTTKSKIRDIVEQQVEINYKMGIKWTIDFSPLRTNWIKEYLSTAPYLILVFMQTYSKSSNEQKRSRCYHEMSVSILCGILITAIQYAGLMTLTSTPLDCGPAIRALLGRPSNEKLVLLLPVGYPDEDATIPKLEQKYLSEILVEID